MAKAENPGRGVWEPGQLVKGDHPPPPLLCHCHCGSSAECVSLGRKASPSTAERPGAGPAETLPVLPATVVGVAGREWGRFRPSIPDSDLACPAGHVPLTLKRLSPPHRQR